MTDPRINPLWNQVRPAAVMLAAFTLITGVAYPLVITGVAQAAFPRQANGSLIERDGRLSGSELIGQPFTDPAHFWSRPSATSPVPYNAGASSGSNLGPLNTTLTDAIRDRVAKLKAADPENGSPVPVDLVTTSASGLDPHISPAAAEYQVERIARVRGLDPARVRALVSAYTEGRQFGVLGEPRVNVLRLNLALDGIR